MLDAFFAMAPTATESGTKYIFWVEDKRQQLRVSKEPFWRHFMSNLEGDERMHLDVVTEVAATMGRSTTGALSWENVVWQVKYLMTN